MEQFSLAEYLKNLTRQIVTRGGRIARIICTDAKRDFPLIALIEKDDSELLVSYTLRGPPYECCESVCDLFFAPEKKEGWINLFKINSTITTGEVYNTKEEAKSAVINSAIYISTIKIEWEE